MDYLNIKIKKNSQIIELKCKKGQNLIDIFKENEIYFPKVCGGNGTCGKCKVKVIKGDFNIETENKAVLTDEEKSKGFILSCKAFVKEDCEIELPNVEEKNIQVLTKYITCSENTVNNSLKIHKIYINEIKKSVSQFVKHKFDIEHFPIYILRKLSYIINQTDKDYVYIITNGNNIVDISQDEITKAYGVAIDIGTTTVAFEIVDIFTGESKAIHSLINRQREFGADVISRILSASNGNLQSLSTSICKDIVLGIHELCKKTGINTENIYKVNIAGNTTMIHLLLQLRCESLGKFPFRAILTSVEKYNFYEFFSDYLKDIKINMGCEVTILPAISSFVGGDITPGIIFCNYKKEKSTSLLVDIGTNGEMALFNDKKIFCTSTAAGPAFEGGNISCGVASVAGAVSKVFYNNGSFECKTIDDKSPIGICGSGIMDAISILFKNDFIDETGAFQDKEHFKKGIYLCDNVCITQKDIREFQLAKSAIRAGLETLIKHAGIEYKDIDRVYLAGGFGFKMNVASAVATGIIPNELEDKIISVGNSSLGGCAKILLNDELEKEIIELEKNAVEINLSEDKNFNNLFMEYMYF